MRKFVDTEYNTIVTEAELLKEFQEMQDDERTFDEYLIDCLGKNGFLKEA